MNPIENSQMAPLQGNFNMYQNPMIIHLISIEHWIILIKHRIHILVHITHSWIHLINQYNPMFNGNQMYNPMMNQMMGQFPNKMMSNYMAQNPKGKFLQGM